MTRMKRCTTSANNAPWFKFWGSDFKSSTVGWTLAEKGGYMELLIASWEADGLPSELERVFLIHGGIEKVWKCLADKFPVAQDGRRRNPRQERIRLEMIELGERNSQRASIASTSRWNATSNASSNATSMLLASPKHSLEQCLEVCSNDAMLDARCQMLDATSKSREKTHTLIGQADEPVVSLKMSLKKHRIPDSEIERVWDCFPRKVGKLKSMALIRKAATIIAEQFELENELDSIEYLIERVQILASESRGKEPQYVPHPATWLNQGRYLDQQDHAPSR